MVDLELSQVLEDDSIEVVEPISGDYKIRVNIALQNQISDHETRIDILETGAGTGGALLTDAPVTPHANDLEFNALALPAGWAWWKSGSPFTPETPAGTIDPYSAATSVARVQYHTDFRRSHLTIQTPDDGGQRCLVRTGGLPTNCFIWARIGVTHRVTPASAESLAQIIFLTDTAGAPSFDGYVALGWRVEAGGSLLQRFESTAGVVRDTTGQLNSAGRNYPYMGIQKIGTTYHGMLYDDSGNCDYLGPRTDAAVFEYVGIIFSDTSDFSPGSLIYQADFLRQQDSAVGWPGKG